MPQLRNPVRVAAALDLLRYPTWSPDGQRLAYESGVGNLNNSDIWVAQPGGGEPVNLTKDSPANDRRPSWSPSGREIAFLSNRDGDWGVYVVAAIGGSPRKVLAMPGLTAAGNSFSAPQWARTDPICSSRQTKTIATSSSTSPSPHWRAPALRFPNTRRHDDGTSASVLMEVGLPISKPLEATLN